MSNEWEVGSAAQYGLFSVAFLFGARALYNFYNNPEPDAYDYIPWSDSLPDDDTVVVDCTHSSLPTLSHHRGHNNPAGLKQADTSTGIVLNALHSRAQWNGNVAAVTHKRLVTTNHFDIDSFLSVWCYINRKSALQHEAVLHHMARIGDYREAFLSPDLITAYGLNDSITFIREAYIALKLCCWINTLEKRMFSAPYESSDCATKMTWFLEHFEHVLKNPESEWAVWEEDFKKVVSGFDLLAGPDCMVETLPAQGLAVLSAPEPLHYYSLFSHTIGYDYVLMMYDDNRYELEAKYTQFTIVVSRPVWPRLDFAPLAAVLNNLEQQQPQQQQQGADADPQEELHWVTNSFTDTGPLLRLQRVGEVLTKAQRYGNPCDRPIYGSSISPSKMQAVVQSFLEFGLQGLRPEPGGWEWRQLQEINRQIHWQDWASCLLEQALHGDLDAITAAIATPRAAVRRRSNPGGAFGTSSSSGGGDGAPASEQQIQLAGLSFGKGSTGFSSPVNLQMPGVPLAATGSPPVLSQPSIVASQGALAALAASLPPLHRGNPWLLIYSTSRDGISLATLLRKAEKVAPTLLLVKDTGGAVFGAYVTDAWRHSTRFYGTGESYVFQLQPQRLMWPWVHSPTLRNDFFQYVSLEGLGVGGAGHWAISMDEELLHGSSGPCDTFASPCLASREEFELVSVELWHVH